MPATYEAAGTALLGLLVFLLGLVVVLYLEALRLTRKLNHPLPHRRLWWYAIRRALSCDWW